MNLITLLVLVFGLALILRSSRLRQSIEADPHGFEIWVLQSKWRMFGLPLAVAIALSMVAHLTGLLLPLLQAASNVFLFLIVFAAAHTLAGLQKIRVSLSLLFITALFTLLLNINFLLQRMH